MIVSQYESFEMLIHDNENMMLRIAIEKFLSPQSHCVKSVRVQIYSVHIIRSISPDSVLMQENTDQNKCEYGHFSRSSILRGKSCDCKYTFVFPKHSVGVSQGLYYSFLRAFIFKNICERPLLIL